MYICMKLDPLNVLSVGVRPCSTARHVGKHRNSHPGFAAPRSAAPRNALRPTALHFNSSLGGHVLT